MSAGSTPVPSPLIITASGITRVYMDNILVRALLAVIVAFILMKYLLPLFLIPNPINWILALIVLIVLLFWVIRGKADFNAS